MTVKDLEGLYDYGYWANRKLFDVISQLTPEQFTRPVAGSLESIRNTMVHVLSAEAGWLDRCGGPKRGSRLEPADFPTIESLMQAWSRVEVHVREFLGKLKDEDLARNAKYRTDRIAKLSMPLGELMQHAANHGVHHRGQVALLLRLLGNAPGNCDILLLCRQARRPCVVTQVTHAAQQRAAGGAGASDGAPQPSWGCSTDLAGGAANAES